MKRYTIVIYLWLLMFSGLAQPGNLQTPDCDAQFQATSDVLNPMKIHFRDKSSGVVSAWQWSFGDGSTSMLQNPDHIYMSGGSYFVCLTITANNGLCHDVLCVAITIHEPGSCVADYHYSFNQGSPLQYHFEDNSSGPVNRWNWDFGDGTTSDQRNPYHEFPGYGDYAVCLTAYHNDSITNCLDTKCDTVRVSPPPQCEARFFAVLDSMNQQPRVFRFNSTSIGNPNQFEWHFGDGTSANGPVVYHQYKNEGQYKVCLTAIRKDGGIIWCADSVCKTIQAPQYYSVGGHLFAGTTPINNPVSTGDTGIVYLYRKNGMVIIPFDTSSFTYLGYYAFPNLLPGEYLLKTELTDGSAHYREFLPSYYPASLNWTQANSLTVTDSSAFHSHINMIKTAEIPVGLCSVHGIAVKGEPGLISPPEPFVEILLLDSQLQPLNFTVTDALGAFSFNNLPYGAYYLYAEVPGKYSRYTAVWLDESASSIDSVLIGVFGHNVTGIGEQGQCHQVSFRIFPNPAVTGFNIVLVSGVNAKLNVQIVDIFGNVRSDKKINCLQGETQCYMDLGGFNSGIYFIRVRDEQGWQETKRLIRW